MSNAHKALYEEIAKLPLHKVGKVLSFVLYLKQEDDDLWLDADFEDELHARMQSDDFVTSSELLAKIQSLPDD